MEPTGIYSANVTVDGQLCTGRARLKSFLLCGTIAVASPGNFKLYDGTSNTDTLKFQFYFPTYTAYTDGRWGVNFPGNGILFESGIYADLTNMSRLTITFQGSS